MALTRWNPFDSMESLMDEGFKLVPMLPRWREPRMDMFEEDGKLHVRLEAPGFDVGEFAISIEGDRLHIRAEHQSQKERQNEKRNYYCKEISKQTFERWIQLPYAVKEDAEARYDEGYLHIELQQTSPNKAKQIKVQHKKR